MSPLPRLLCGLGNPGLEYHGTRHNIGFRVLDNFVREERMSFRRSPYQGYLAKGNGSLPLYLLKPTTYMNLSGRSVRQAAAALNIQPEEILCVCDDLDLPAGQIRLRAEGGSGGHNGLKSVIAELGTQRFARLRIGIGRPPDDDVVRFVLGAPRGEEAIRLAWATDLAVQCLRTAVHEGVEAAMTAFNGQSYPA
jgi:PTH1 family peptidyl-tRNA hydrolase